MKRNIVVIALILLAVIVFSAWYFFPHSSNANPPSRVIFMHPNGSTDTVYVQVANTLQEQEQGLMYRTSLPEDNGMLFVFNTNSVESFWMENTPLPLDMIFVSENLTINDINYNAKPESTTTFTSSSPCKYVVEVNGGYCVRHGISPGDKIKIDM
jgi:hypothetical protein